MRRGYNNLGKIYRINTVIPVAAKIVDVTGSYRKIPVSRYPPTSKKWQAAIPAFHFWLFTQTGLRSA